MDNNLSEKIEKTTRDVSNISDPDEIRESCIMGLQSRVADFSPRVWTYASEWMKRIDYNEDRFTLAALMEDEESRALRYLPRRQVKELLRQILVDDLGVAPDAWGGEQNIKLLEGINIKIEAEFYITADEFAKLYRTIQRRCESVPFRYNAEDIFIGFQKALTVQAVWDGIRPLPPKEGIMSLPCSFLGETTEEVIKKLVKNNIAPLHTRSDMKRAVFSLWETFDRLELLYGSGVAYRLSRGDTSDFETLDVDEREYYRKLAEVLYPKKSSRKAH